MANYYSIEIWNEYLGKHRRVTGRTRREAELKASMVLGQWEEQEEKARYRQAIADAKAHAQALTDEAQASIEEHKAILAATMHVDDRVRWDKLMAPRLFREPEPKPQDAADRMNVPRPRPLTEAILKSKRAEREALERSAEELHTEDLEGWRIRRERFLREAESEIAEIRLLKERYEAGDSEAVEQYAALVLSQSTYPTTFTGQVTVDFQIADRTVVAEVELPRLDEIPAIAQYKFDATQESLVAKPLSESALMTLYDDVVYQVVLRTIHELFEGDYCEYVDCVVVNTRTSRTNPATGIDEDLIVATCSATRDEFDKIDLSRVQPRDCFRALKGMVARRPASMVPVSPLRVISSDFGSEIELMSPGGAPADLLEMDPFAFEELVGALFRRVFNVGTSVEVTQASRDGGVDVLILDPDELRGGKIVVQVKRYGGAVGVGYVRELYGTMLNAGAAKGVLVATGRYGPDAHVFAQDKPITLIDGGRLLEMLGEHGWHYRIGDNAPAPPSSGVAH